MIICGCKKNDDCDNGSIHIPRLEVNDDYISFSGETPGQLVIKVSPATSIQWRIASLPYWLNAEPSEGTMNNEQVINLLPKMGLIDDSQVNGQIDIISEKASKVSCQVSYRLMLTSSIKPEYSNNIVGYNTDEKIITMKSESSKELHWEIEPEDNFLEVEPSSGTVGDHEDFYINVIADKSSLPNGETKSNLTLTDSNGGTQIIEVRILKYIEEKWLLNKQLRTTTYDRTNDRIMAVTREPYEFLILYPDEEIMETITLAHEPTCIAINTDGSKSVIGCEDGYLIFVNNTNLSITSSFIQNEEIYSVVYGNGEKVYFNFDYVLNNSIYVFDLNNSTISEYYEYGMASGTRLNLHPSNNYLYSFYSSAGIKYDISTDTVSLVHRKYQSSYDNAELIFFNEDGSKMYAGSSVYRSSENSELDFNYISTCPEPASIQLYDYSSSNQMLLAKNNSMGHYYLVLVHEPSMTITNVFDLPQFFDPEGSGSTSTANCYMGYFNNDGTKFHAFVGKSSWSGDKNWAIKTYENY